MGLTSFACSEPSREEMLAGQFSPAASSGDESLPRDEDFDRIRRDAEQQTSRIRELESSLALSSAEVRDLRAAVAERPGNQRSFETVRIGEERQRPTRQPREEEYSWGGENEGYAPSAPTRAARQEPRPVLRLYGSESAQEPSTAASTGRLPAARPSYAGSVPLIPADAASSASDDHYRQALAHLSARRSREADEQFRLLLVENARSPRAADALYWRGEIARSEGRTADAGVHFARVLHEHPRSSRAPDSLLRLVRLHEGTHDTTQAAAFRDQLLREYPSSRAAQALASGVQR